MNILVIGSGAREHALCENILKSPLCDDLSCAPGSAGIAEIATCLPDIGAKDIDAIVTYCKNNKPDLVVIGPDDTLALGLTDELEKLGIPAFGPSQKAAKIEWSKAYMKDLCRTCGINTAAYGCFTEMDKAKNFINSMDAPIVVKADGLALGKGVLICENHCVALRVAENMLSGDKFGDAGREIVVEEFMTGFEVSYFAFVDGNTVLSIGHAQDHKRVGEGDTGPNTGGMGAISPAPNVTPEMEDEIINDIFKPIAKKMTDDGTPFRGILFAGLMIDGLGTARVIEFNARWGDPECQSILPRVDTDLVPIMLATAKGELATIKEPIKLSNKHAFGVFLAAKGYPESYQKNTVIKLPEQTPKNIHVFQAGTLRNDNGTLRNGGGRTLSIVALSDTIEQARDDAYAYVDNVDWAEKFYRRDIGWRAFK